MTPTQRLFRAIKTGMLAGEIWRAIAEAVLT